MSSRPAVSGGPITFSIEGKHHSLPLNRVTFDENEKLDAEEWIAARDLEGEDVTALTKYLDYLVDTEQLQPKPEDDNAVSPQEAKVARRAKKK
jgi:hypothetical protein